MIDANTDGGKIRAASNDAGNPADLAATVSFISPQAEFSDGDASPP